MTVTARWPRIPIAAVVGGGLVTFVLVYVQATAALLVALAMLAAWMVARVRVQAVGGGFRPLRTVDLLEFNALDHLDAWDREQAIARAQR